MINMKLKVFSFFMVLYIFASSLYAKSIVYGLFPYQENGKWGVMYDGKTCLLPRFDGIIGDVKCGRFVYKEGNEYGISTIWKKVTEPFCDSLVLMEDYDNIHKSSAFFAKYKKNGKWGVCNVDGSIILPPQYKEVDNFHYGFYHVFRESAYKYRKYPIIRNHYFIVNDGLSHKIIDILGKTIISDIDNPSLFIKDGKIQKKIRKIAKKKELSRNDGNEISEMYNKIDSINKSTTLYVEKQYWSYTDFNADAVKRYNSMKEPHRLYFGDIEAFGDSAIIDGFESLVNDYGFISTPLMYDSPYFKLKTNPLDVSSMLYIIDMEEVTKGSWYGKPGRRYLYEDEVRDGTIEEDIIRMENRLVNYQELINLAKEINDTIALKKVTTRYNELKKLKYDIEEAYEREVKRFDFNDRVDRFANAATSILNSVASALGGGESNTNTCNKTPNSGYTNNVPAKQDDQMSISDQINYNSMRNTYNKWAQDLMQMKNVNGKYQNGFKPSDKKHAQDEMKRIRKSAMLKWNKEIPYNSIENW